MKLPKIYNSNNDWSFGPAFADDSEQEEPEKLSNVYPFIEDEEPPIEIATLEEYEQRLARAIWIKGIYQNRPCPQKVFTLIVNADISPVALEHWYREGGLDYVIELCEGLFPIQETATTIYG